MQKTEFAEKIGELIEESAGIRVNVGSTVKNGVPMTSMTMKGYGVRPTVYVDHLYEDYCSGSRGLDEIAEYVVTVFKEHEVSSDGYDIIEFVTDWESAKKSLRISVRNADLNRDILMDVPHVMRGDLAVMYRLDICTPEIGDGSILIRNELMQKWGISLEELDKTAWENTKSRPYVIENLLNVIRNMLINNGVSEDALDYMPDCDAAEKGMFVLTNEQKFDGAGYFLDDEILHEISEKIGAKDFVILPSSIHEAIIVPINEDTSMDAFADMVESVNDNEVPNTDILSYNVYCYMNGELTYYDRDGFKSMAA